MLILHPWRFAWARVVATAFIPITLASRLRASIRSHRTRAALTALDRRTLADIGIGPDEILSLAHTVGFGRLRRPPHV
jgi:uncharacterized protein YjiS (DUF1127 family)